jgi:DNA mismatch repair protein MutL
MGNQLQELSKKSALHHPSVENSMESPSIRILDDTVVNQIAAGEVVERPVSVVKELVENAVDAHADQITVSLTNGGKSLLEVIDNGVGMGKHDALLAVERFGTSKVRSVDDLQSISTHGFRGEALPSIASVSRFQLSSMRAMQSGNIGSEVEAQDAGVEISITGGKLRDVVEKQMNSPRCFRRKSHPQQKTADLQQVLILTP